MDDGGDTEVEVVAGRVREQDEIVSELGLQPLANLVDVGVVDFGVGGESELDLPRLGADAVVDPVHVDPQVLNARLEPRLAVSHHLATEESGCGQR